MVSNTMNRPSSPLGVIDALSMGFQLVATRWHLFLIPLVLDVLILFAPSIDFSPVLNDVSDASYHVISQRGGTLFEPSQLDEEQFHQTMMWVFGGNGPRYMPNVGAPRVLAGSIQTALLARTDPDSWLAGSQALQLGAPLVWTPVGIPSLLVGRTLTELPFVTSAPVIEIETAVGMVAWVSVTTGFGFIAGIMYLTLIAAEVTAQPWRIMVAKMMRYSIRIIGVMIVVAILSVIVGLPFWFLAAVVSIQSPGLGLFTLSLGALVVLWCLFFLVFAEYGVLLHERPPLAALWDSMRVVQWYLPATALIVVLVFVLDVTLTQIWSIFCTGWMLFPGLIGHAVVSAALISALLVYYHNRYQCWAEERAKLLKELRRQQAQKSVRS